MFAARFTRSMFVSHWFLVYTDAQAVAPLDERGKICYSQKVTFTKYQRFLVNWSVLTDTDTASHQEF